MRFALEEDRAGAFFATKQDIRLVNVSMFKYIASFRGRTIHISRHLLKNIKGVLHLTALSHYTRFYVIFQIY